VRSNPARVYVGWQRVDELVFLFKIYLRICIRHTTMPLYRQLGMYVGSFNYVPMT
jgi:hypothetical protein